jgi:hypothetical protein
MMTTSPHKMQMTRIRKIKVQMELKQDTQQTTISVEMVMDRFLQMKF